jgi:hypothetical protein
MGSTKYGNQRRCSSLMLEGFNLSEKSTSALLEVGDHGLAKSMWSTYSTAQRMLAKCAKETKKKMELPLSQADLLEYIGWLISERNLKAGTVNSYLSGLTAAHSQGHRPTEYEVRASQIAVTRKEKHGQHSSKERRTGEETANHNERYETNSNIYLAEAYGFLTIFFKQEKKECTDREKDTIIYNHISSTGRSNGLHGL